VLQLFVVTTSRYPINPITNPNPSLVTVTRDPVDVSHYVVSKSWTIDGRCVWNDMTGRDNGLIDVSPLKYLRILHGLSTQPHGRTFRFVQRDLEYADFGSRLILKIDRSNILTADHSGRAV
jgi:hypothetical protein